jgi:hypothetical protein
VTTSTLLPDLTPPPDDTPPPPDPPADDGDGGDDFLVKVNLCPEAARTLTNTPRIDGAMQPEPSGDEQTVNDALIFYAMLMRVAASGGGRFHHTGPDGRRHVFFMSGPRRRTAWHRRLLAWRNRPTRPGPSTMSPASPAPAADTVGAPALRRLRNNRRITSRRLTPRLVAGTYMSPVPQKLPATGTGDRPAAPAEAPAGRRDDTDGRRRGWATPTQRRDIWRQADRLYRADQPVRAIAAQLRWSFGFLRALLHHGGTPARRSGRRSRYPSIAGLSPAARQELALAAAEHHRHGASIKSVAVALGKTYPDTRTLIVEGGGQIQPHTQPADAARHARHAGNGFPPGPYDDVRRTTTLRLL